MELTTHEEKGKWGCCSNMKEGHLTQTDGSVWGLRKGLLEAGTSREGWGGINKHNRQIKGGGVGHQKDQLEASHLGPRPASTNNLCKPSALSSAHFSSPVIWDGQITSVDLIPRCAQEPFRSFLKILASSLRNVVSVGRAAALLSKAFQVLLIRKQNCEPLNVRSVVFNP